MTEDEVEEFKREQRERYEMQQRQSPIKEDQKLLISRHSLVSAVTQGVEKIHENQDQKINRELTLKIRLLKVNRSIAVLTLERKGSMRPYKRTYNCSIKWSNGR